MILSNTEITSIIKDNPGKDIIAKGRTYSTKMRRHLYGTGLAQHIETITGYEKDEAKNLRAKYTRSNKDLFARLSRPIDKVFTAKGGSVYYNLTDQQQKKAVTVSSTISGQYNVKKWVETFWKPHMLDDPFGIILMEIMPEQEAITSKNNGRTFVYPTYKPVSDIYDYKVTGNRLEWVVFTLTKAEKAGYGIKQDIQAYRLIDDAFDYIVVFEGETASVRHDLTIKNFFGYVPGIINTDLKDHDNENLFISFFDEIIELADEFLRKGSIKGVHDFLHGFPKYAEFADDCPECGGTKFSEGDKCKSCKGTGKKILSKVSEAKLLTWPSKDEQVILPENVAGYVSPDKTFHEIATFDISALENLMHFTLWGTSSRLKQSISAAGTGGEIKTATEIVDEMKPMADRLATISEMAERRHKFILDAIISLNLSLPNYPGSSVNYGRRFLLESADAVWEKYVKAKEKGAPQNVLDTLLNEYIESNYQSDPVGMEVAKRLIYVEPFVHYSAVQLKALSPSDDDYKAKLYFPEWLSQIGEGELIIKSATELKSSLYEYTKPKQLKEPAALPEA